MKELENQIAITEYLADRDGTYKHCGKCVCKHCLYWWSGRCPYGSCYDDYRAKEEPYNEVHPNQPPRKGWSNWNLPGEQKHWCRGGIFYPVHYCKHFTKYTKCEVRECLKEVVQVFQDGYISCSIIETVGCEQCYAELMEKTN